MTKQDEYNGWTNYETWNVALWIENDEGLYDMARTFRGTLSPYRTFVESLQELGVVGGQGAINNMTPDGVRWNDPDLDIDELDKMIEEL